MLDTKISVSSPQAFVEEVRKANIIAYGVVRISLLENFINEAATGWGVIATAKVLDEEGDYVVEYKYDAGVEHSGQGSPGALASAEAMIKGLGAELADMGSNHGVEIREGRYE